MMGTITAYHVEASLEATDAAAVRLRREANPFFDEAGLARFELAAAEALTNIVRHGYVSSLKGDIGVRLESGDDETLRLVLTDSGSAAPLSVFTRPQSLNEQTDPTPRENGWGLGLIHQCASAVEYGREAGRNVLTLTFKTDSMRKIQ